MPRSLLNFQPLLTNYQPGKAGEIRNRAIKESFGYLAEGIKSLGEKGREREKEYHSIMDFDSNKINNNEARLYAVKNWSKLRGDWIQTMQENKDLLGYSNLTSEQKILLQSDMDSFEKDVVMIDGINKGIDQSKKYIEKEGYKKGEEFNDEKYNEYLKALKSGNVRDMAEFTSSINDSPTDNPFTKFIKKDPDLWVRSQVDVLRDTLKTIEGTDTITKDIGGKKITTTVKSTGYGTEEGARWALYNIMSNPDTAKSMEWNLKEIMTDEEKVQAELKYESRVPNPYTAWYALEKADVSPIIEKGTIESRKEQPITKKKAGVDKGISIKRTDIGTAKTGWKFGTTPVSIVVETPDGTVSGKVYEITEKKGKYFAKIQVPILSGEAKKKLYELIESGDDVGVDEFLDAKIARRYKTKEIPLENIYKELSVAFKRYPKGGINLEGFDNIQFDDKKEKTYKLDGVEYTKQELIDAGWSESDLKRL